MINKLYRARVRATNYTFFLIFAPLVGSLSMVGGKPPAAGGDECDAGLGGDGGCGVGGAVGDVLAGGDARHGVVHGEGLERERGGGLGEL